MLEAIDEVCRATADKSFEAFQQDWVLRKAAERGIEIISEASRHLPDPSSSRVIRTPDGVTSPGSEMCCAMSITGSRIGSSGPSFGTSCLASRSISRRCIQRSQAAIRSERLDHADLRHLPARGDPERPVVRRRAGAARARAQPDLRRDRRGLDLLRRADDDRHVRGLFPLCRCTGVPLFLAFGALHPAGRAARRCCCTTS